MHALFRRRGASRVIRYVLPNLRALNFVVDDVLEGGVNASLSLDGHGMSNSFRVLELQAEAAAGLLPRLAAFRS